MDDPVQPAPRDRNGSALKSGCRYARALPARAIRVCKRALLYSDLPEYIVPPASTPPVVLREAPYTVLTMAPDGSWGVATSIFIREAITGAMTDCMSMSGRKLGCGYMSKAGRGEWVLGVRCGSENILAASKMLANAELAAFNRETELRQHGRNMPPCFRLVTVHPDGLVADTKTRVPTLTLEHTGVNRN